MSRNKLSSVFLTILLVLPFQASSQTEKVMTNQDVIRLAKLGLTADIIITKINDSPANFDLSVEGLAALSQNRVPNEVIKTMQAKASEQPRTTSSTSRQFAPPGGGVLSDGVGASSAGNSRSGSYPLPPDKGAYLWDSSRLHLLYQTNVPSMGSAFWRKVVPFIHQKIELQLVGPRAKAHYDDNRPTIVVSGLGEIIPGIPTFRWLYVKTGGMLKDRRIVGTYEVGGFFGSTQIVDNEIDCDIKKLREGVYAITPRKPLPDGEYGLVQVPKVMDVSARKSFSLPVWDFGIYVEGR